LRVVEHGATEARIAGNIWDICQSLHAFWLELERQNPESDELQWSFYFDAVPGPRGPRRIDLVAEAIDRADQTEWRVVVTGTAHLGSEGMVVMTTFSN
jgi:hypothetical protein